MDDSSGMTALDLYECGIRSGWGSGCEAYACVANGAETAERTRLAFARRSILGIEPLSGSHEHLRS